MSWMMEQSGKQCQCERLKRQTEKTDAHEEKRNTQRKQKFVRAEVS